MQQRISGQGRRNKVSITFGEIIRGKPKITINFESCSQNTKTATAAATFNAYG